MERGTRDIPVDDLWTIADLCGVPREFMERGFDSVPAHLKELHGRFDALEERLGWSVAHAIGQAASERLRDDDGNGS
jgi:hypothetical protein